MRETSSGIALHAFRGGGSIATILYGAAHRVSVAKPRSHSHFASGTVSARRPFTFRVVIDAGFLEPAGYAAMQRLLAAGTRVDAVFAANDPTAIGAMKAIWEAGLRVPEDIAVVGAGDIWHADLLRVPLTTVAWSKGEMGRRAAELILEQIGTPDSGRFQRIIVPPRLVVRKSCGAK